MKLVQPTDFEILDALSDGKRNTAANISQHVDKKRGYINTRLPELADKNLIRRVGPSPNSGLYEITDRGVSVLKHRDQYDTVDNFGELVDEAVSESTSSA